MATRRSVGRGYPIDIFPMIDKIRFGSPWAKQRTADPDPPYDSPILQLPQCRNSTQHLPIAIPQHLACLVFSKAVRILFAAKCR